MWADQLLHDTWENLEDVAHRLRRGNVHYHNVIEVIASLQIAITTLDRLQSSIDAIKDDIHRNHH
jgi:hypothetical protein